MGGWGSKCGLFRLAVVVPSACRARETEVKRNAKSAVKHPPSGTADTMTNILHPWLLSSA